MSLPQHEDGRAYGTVNRMSSSGPSPKSEIGKGQQGPPAPKGTISAAKQVLSKALPHHNMQMQQTKVGSNPTSKAAIEKQTRTRKAIAAFRKRKDRGYDEWKGRIGVHVQVDEFDLKTLEDEGYLEELCQTHGWEYVNHYDVIRLWHRDPVPRDSISGKPSETEAGTTSNSGTTTAANQLDGLINSFETKPFVPRLASNGSTSVAPLQSSLDSPLIPVQYDYGSMTDGDAPGPYPEETLTSVANQLDAWTPEVFIFSFGAVVFWNFPSEEAEQSFLDQHLLQLDDVSGTRHDERAIASASDDLEFVYDDKFVLRRDVCTLQTKEPGEKMAVSFGLAKSSLLSVYEWMLQKTIERNSSIPELLAATGNIPMTKLNISKEIGRIFLVKHGINLDSNLHDTPEEFWEDDRFEQTYIKTMEYFEIGKRMALINARLGMLHDLHKVLIEEVQNHHSTHLEWIVIWLIVIEVVFELYHAVRG